MRKRRLIVPEVIQTSAMDCGPATLKAILEGHYINASYGRLREACQTTVDGTSIDAIEAVAQQLGLDAEQVLIPLDHLWTVTKLPFLLVVRRPNAATHFIVVWRRFGSWIQIMDPAVGRRWVNRIQLEREIHIAQFLFSYQDWYQWAIDEDCQNFLRKRLSQLGVASDQCKEILNMVKPYWYSIATLDAAIRMVNHLHEVGGVKKGTQSFGLLKNLVDKTLNGKPENKSDAIIPANYWSVGPELHEKQNMLPVRGAVLVKINGRRTKEIFEEAIQATKAQTELSHELDAALKETPVKPSRELWRLVKMGGIVTPIVLFCAAGLAMGAVMIEALLFRGIFDIAVELNIVSQRAIAFFALLLFVLLLWLIELPIISESLRLGRQLEIRLRILLADKLPKLNDRYLQSRPISDMAERSHSIYLLRQLPEQVVLFVRSSWELIFTLVGIGFIASHSLAIAFCMVGLSIGLSLLAHPLMSERDLRLRSHAGALQRFYLDAMLGIVPIRTHSAERSVRREHETLLCKWALAAKSPVRLSLLLDGIRGSISMILAGYLIYAHIISFGISGNLLLLVYWLLKLPVLGKRLSDLIIMYPMQRSIALRLLEPIKAPADTKDMAGKDKPEGKTKIVESCSANSGMEIYFHNAKLIASGQDILEIDELRINSGEHIAIVGPSGAGKSSLLSLLLGWHKSDQGQIFIDGSALSVYGLQKLRNETAWLDPAVQLWNRSLWENLRFNPSPGKYASLGKVIHAADLTQILANSAEGLQTTLGEGGAKLSGGEGQRVRLARTLWQTNVRLALLDEPFRGLDRNQRLQKLIQTRRHWEKATLLCVSHDIRETLTFPRVIIIENGRIIEDGNPKQLAQCKTHYQNLLNAEKSMSAMWHSSVWKHINIHENSDKKEPSHHYSAKNE